MSDKSTKTESEVPEASSPAVSENSAVGDSATAEPLHPLAKFFGRPFDIRSFSLTGLFVLAMLYTMYFSRGILLPIVLAILMSQLLAPFVRTLARWHIPQMAGSGLILLTLCATVAFAFSFLIEPAEGWIDKAPEGLREIQAKLIPLLQRPIQKVSQASGEVDKLTAAAGASKKTVVEVQQHSAITTLLFQRTQGIVASMLTFLILLYFLLGYKGVFLKKLVKVIPKFQDKKLAVTIANDIEDKISAYLLTITLINCGLGCAVAVAMYFLGMPNPLLWGVAATILNFVPYLGAFTGIGCMTIAAMLSYDSMSYALMIPGVYLLIAIIEGNFITPMILGRSLTMNPVAIIVSIMFWGWMWGIIGVILAVPLLATIKILCDHIESLAPLGEFISD